MTRPTFALDGRRRFAGGRRVVGVVDGGPAEIDGDLTAGLPQLRKRLLVLDQKPLNEEGCVEPRPVQGRHEHAQGELVD